MDRRSADSGSRARSAAAALLLAVPAQVLAQGCAMCRTTLQGQDDPLVGAINTSVIFLMSMPFLIVGTVGGWMYLTVRRHRIGSPAETYDSMEVEGDDT